MAMRCVVAVTQCAGSNGTARWTPAIGSVTDPGAGCDVVEVQRLFDEQHAMLPRQPRQQLLRALPDEIPAQVAVDDDGHTCGHRGQGSKRALH